MTSGYFLFCWFLAALPLLLVAPPPCGTPQNPCAPTESPVTPIASPTADPIPSPSKSPIVATPTTASEYTLVWSDEFDGPSIDSNNWNFDIGYGTNGWGNNELQWYLSENAEIVNGILIITAKKERVKGQQYTSARLNSKNKQEFTYGKFESRMKLPSGIGIWPAFWLLGNNIDTVSWPQCGELDIMEHIGNNPDTIYGTIHGPNYSGANGIGGSITDALAQYEGTFHVYSMEWDGNSNQISWYIDDVLFASVNENDDLNGNEWVFDHPFYVLINLAVGGNWAGDPDATTVFPQTFEIDYIRVYQKN